MPRRRKFRKGNRIDTVEEAASLILSGHWVYCHHKPLHPGWTSSWPLNLIKNFVSRGSLFRADHNEEPTA